MQTRTWAVVAVALAALLILLALTQRAGVPAASPTVGSGASASLGPSPPAPATPPETPIPTAIPSTVPAFGHVFVIVMENKEAGAIIGNDRAPYINALARQYGLAADYTAVAHPSQPNYLALWSGSTRGVTDDRVHDFGGGATLADQIEASGRSWHVAAQNVPLDCYTGASASGGADGPGTYARKHEPAISWTSVSGDPARCARITDLAHFDPNLGDFWLVVPNLCNDMHDCSIATGDRFLQGWLPRILGSAAFADGVVFLTWDEGSSAVGGGGRVATIVVSPVARPTFRSATRYSHYSLLRTIEDAWGLPCLGRACSADAMAEFFR